ncbi:hypothetical protein LMG24076_02736 [Trinickia soli]|uniref:Uncharacterized protein n=2 Tax=Trinickia soli TaxID=380675 RepID=A0A2N7W760_9BURK|nr:hypothetical protein C0Z19_09755 [Trinickia soli]CAB3687131.1 hypothetical protein LMG24076_02736 [Trinickia soli]
MARPQIDQWETESVRATFFGSPTEFGRSREMWKTLVGKDPEVSTGRPAEGLVMEEGSFGDGRRLTVNAAAGRIDVAISPQVAPVWPSLGIAPAAIGDLVQLLSARRALFAGATRYALGIAATCRVRDRDVAYGVLGELLDCVQVTPNMHDLFFQVNYPRNSRVVDVQVNRLGRWMAGKINLGFIGQPEMVDLGEMVRAELDINTPPTDSLTLDDQQFEPLLNEFADMAIEMLERGATP